MSGWWYRASREQKLAQVDGAIELGMTVSQLSLVSGGVPAETIWGFAAYHGRRFPAAQAKSKRGAAKRWDTTRRRNAYLAGLPTDQWANGVAGDGERDDALEELILE